MTFEELYTLPLYTVVEVTVNFHLGPHAVTFESYIRAQRVNDFGEREVDVFYPVTGRWWVIPEYRYLDDNYKGNKDQETTYTARRV